MTKRDRTLALTRPGISLILLVFMLAALWIAGGASRADVAGQIVSRAAATTVLVAAILLGPRPSFADHRPVLILLLLALLLAVLQLIPLPPSVWASLPGRGFMLQAMALSGQTQPWRPLSIVPSATFNAAASLIVPLAVLLCLSGLRQDDRRWLPIVVLSLMAASMLVALIQFSGSRFSQPLINYTQDVSGTFANRNHFAVFAALGCLIAPVWALAGQRRPTWRLSVAAGLILLFILTILASGSRAGMAAAGFGLIASPMMVREDLRHMLRGRPRWLLPASMVALIAVVALFVVLSIALGKAVSVDRLLDEGVAHDMRSRGLPTVLAIVATYLPWGAGLGGFDTMFRMHEPFALLKLTYFNQAHDDYLGLALDAGLPGLLIVAAALGWWLIASIAVWRNTDRPGVIIGRLGSAVMFVLFLTSLVDYPVRTPLMMAIVVIASCWLAWGWNAARQTSLPTGRQ